MKKIIFLILLFLGTLTAYTQTIIAKQSFEATGDTWSPLNFSTPPCSSFGDVWNYSTNINGLTPSEGNRFWGIRDLNGNCGGNGFETITFPNVNVSTYDNIVFSFEYFANSFDNNDDLKYELFYDGVSQGEVFVIDGVNDNSDNTNGWQTESVSIPTTVTNVSLILSARNNHGSDIGGFDNVLLLSSPITNGGCSNATNLTVGENNTENISTGTNVGATSSGEQPAPSCGNYNGRDVWYTAQIPANGNIIVETLSSVIDPSLAIYTGSCGNLTEIACNDDVDYPNSLESQIELTGLPNTTIYIRVYAYNNASSGEFNIVAYSPPTTSNDNCFTAQELTVGNSNTENVVTSTNEGATSSNIGLNPNCDSYQGGDVWFTTQVPASGFLTIETLNAGGIDDTGLAVYTGSDCNNLTQIACDADSGNGFFSLINLSGLPNTTVYIRVWEYQNNAFGAFNIVAYSPECPLSTTWNGSSWSNGAPNEYTSATINGNYNTTTNGNFESCNCTVNSGNTLNVAANNYIKIDNNLTVNGTLNIQHEGSLVMVQDDGIVSGSGATNVYKTSRPYNQNDYMYWSSPTANENISGVFIDSDPSYIYRYNHQTGWVNVNGSTTMTPGVGFIAEGNINGSFPRTESIVFNGRLNTGTITTTVNTTGVEGFDWNLIGNPYPSAINATNFLNNNSNLNATIYLWTHNTEISENNTGVEKYNYSSNDYATYTAGTGGVAAVSGGAIPNGFIASGQGFFVQANTAGSITFNNSMRVTDNNNQLFRPDNEKSTVEKDRIWLNLKNNKGAFSQILIGYLPKATDGIDKNFDGKRLAGNSHVSFYSLIEDKTFAIQGRKPITEEDEVKLGFNTSIATGEKLIISIHNIEGQLHEYNVYLKDNLLGLTHNLKAGDYEFTITQKGTFNDRFELQFTKSAVLSVEDENVTNENLLISTNDNQLNVRTANGAFITNLKAYDILGRLIINSTSNKDSFTTNIGNIKTGTVLIINTELENNQKITKKIIVQ